MWIRNFQTIGLRIDALDATSVIHPSLEWDILKVIGRDMPPGTRIIHWSALCFPQVMAPC